MRSISVLLILAGLLTVFSACTAIQIGGELILNKDGSGSRKLVLHLFDSSNDDGYGNAYKYSRLHGNALKAKIEEKLKANLADSSWLTVSVHSGTEINSNYGIKYPVEFITLAYNFTNFQDYVDKTTRLAKFGRNTLPEGSLFTAPSLTGGDDIYRYKENPDATLWTVKPLFLAMINDPDVFDFSARGENTKATLDELLQYGIEMKGVEIALTFGVNEPLFVISGDNINEMFSMSGQKFDWVREPTDLALYYDFDGNTENKGIAGGAANLILGEGSSMSTVTYADGIKNKGLLLDGSTYLKTPAAYSFSEFTVSFYFKPAGFLETDTGAGMLLVCNGLGALAPGALDVEFFMYKDEPFKPVIFMSKTNGSNWVNGDRMQTESFFNNRLNEWHHFAVVYENDYDNDGYFDVSYITLYIDGIKYGRMEQYNAAGLNKQIGVKSSDETASLPGFSIGGYYEAGLVKRGIKGVLDEVRIYDGPLTQAEIEDLYRANPVKSVYDPEDITNIDLSASIGKGKLSGIIVIIIIAAAAVLAGIVLFAVKKRKKL
jgi:hypothetical protein